MYIYAYIYSVPYIAGHRQCEIIASHLNIIAMDAWLAIITSESIGAIFVSINGL